MVGYSQYQQAEPCTSLCKGTILRTLLGRAGHLVWWALLPWHCPSRVSIWPFRTLHTTRPTEDTLGFSVVFQVVVSDVETRKYRTGEPGIYIHVRSPSRSLRIDSNLFVYRLRERLPSLIMQGEYISPTRSTMIPISTLSVVHRTPDDIIPVFLGLHGLSFNCLYSTLLF